MPYHVIYNYLIPSQSFNIDNVFTMKTGETLVCVGLKIVHTKIYAVKLCSRVFDFAHEPVILRGNIDSMSGCLSGNSASRESIGDLLLPKK